MDREALEKRMIALADELDVAVWFERYGGQHVVNMSKGSGRALPGEVLRYLRTSVYIATEDQEAHAVAELVELFHRASSLF
jgi:hypothetical protein